LQETWRERAFDLSVLSRVLTPRLSPLHPQVDSGLAMFYIRSMSIDSRNPGSRAPGYSACVGFPSGGFDAPGAQDGSREKSPKTKKRIRRVESGKKRGGQPGNSNALKTGRYTGPVRGARKQIRGFQRGVRAILANVEADLAARRKGLRP
jgi:hypothetical protein